MKTCENCKTGVPDDAATCASCNAQVSKTVPKAIKSTPIILGFLGCLGIIVILAIASLYIYSKFARPTDFETIKMIPKESTMYLSLDLRKGTTEKFKSLGDFSKTYENLKKYEQQAKEFEEKTGVNLKDDVLSWVGPVASIGLFDFTPPFNQPKLIIVLTARDPKKAETSIKAIKEKIEKKKNFKFNSADYGTAKIYYASTPKNKEVAFTYFQGFVLIGSSLETVKKSIDTSKNLSLSIKENPNFKAVQEKMKKEQLGMGYINIGAYTPLFTQMLRAKGNLPPVLIEFVGDLDNISGALYDTNDGLVIDSYISTKQSNNIFTQKLFYQEGTEIKSLSAIPQTTQRVTIAYNIKEIIECILAVVKGQPQLENSYKMLKQQMNTEIGIDFEKDILEQLSGELITVDKELNLKLGKNRMTKGRELGQLTACESNLKNIGTALEMYSTDNKGKYPANLSLLIGPYMRNMPSCPTLPFSTYQYKLIKDNEYIIECPGDHSSLGLPKGYPQYSALKGLDNKGIEKPKQEKQKFTLLIGIKDEQSFNNTLTKFKSKAGALLSFQEETYEGVKIYSSDKLSYALTTNYLIITNNEAQQIKDIIAAQKGKAPSLISLPNYPKAMSLFPKKSISFSYTNLKALGEQLKQVPMKDPEKMDKFIKALERFPEVWASSTGEKGTIKTVIFIPKK